MQGVVNLDKPVGPTSHDMVGLLRRLTGTRRIGHAGTLDPLASGVLPILVGPATRFSEELTGGRKGYHATVRLGVRSATDDAEGPLEPGAESLPDPADVERVLTTFIGTFDQRPPAFSARRADGRRGYRAARAGGPLDLPARQVTIDSIDPIAMHRGSRWLDVEIDVRCGPGTYIRSLARDLGERLGCGGYLAGLRRTEAAGLRVENASTPDALQRLAEGGRLEEVIHPIAGLVPLPRIVLAPADAARFLHGRTVQVPGTGDGRHVVLAGEELLGIGTLAAGVLQPNKVVASQVPVSASR